MPQSDKIRELAEKGRKRREELAVEAATSAMEQSQEPPEEWGPGDLASKALGNTWSNLLLLGLAGIVGMGLAVGLSIWMDRSGFSFAYVLGAILVLGVWFLVWVLSMLLYQWSALRKIERLRALPFFRDTVRSYVDLLDGGTQSTRIRLEVRFVTAPSEPQQRTCLDMILAIHAETTACWEDATLVLSSPEITTRFTPKNSFPRYDNRLVHEWFERFLRDFLIPVNESVPISRVQIFRAR